MINYYQTHWLLLWLAVADDGDDAQPAGSLKETVAFVGDVMDERCRCLCCYVAI